MCAWILFVGVCIDAGGFISNAVYDFFNPAAASHFWNRIDFSQLYQYDKGYFVVIAILISIVACVKAWMFWQIIRLLEQKKLNFSQPFSVELGQFLSIMAFLTLLIGFFSLWGVRYSSWLALKGISMPDIQQMRVDGSDVWFFMSGTLYVITLIFKRGIELQKENELTV
jgi:hypothetical protein